MTQTEALANEVFIHPSSYVDAPCVIGAGTRIWHFCHISKDAFLGARCVLGQNVFIGERVIVGSGVKIQNNVSVYTGTVVEDDVFLGPSCVLTNVSNPRAAVVRKPNYETTRIRRGSTIGANATIVCGVTLGPYSFVSAGAVVTNDVPAYGLMMGAPARLVGWMSRHGHRLLEANGGLVCPESQLRYAIDDGVCRCLDMPDDSELTRSPS
jgi:UDP-2-acetamido-3-amino-2,3-dideoxy-glucuronate N-acetyltransferase